MRTMWKVELDVIEVGIVTGYPPGVQPGNWSGPDVTCGLDPSGAVCVWVLADPDLIDANCRPRRFKIAGTGRPLGQDRMRYIGAITMRSLVWHVVELLP